MKGGVGTLVCITRIWNFDCNFICNSFNEVSQGRAPQGAEYYLPLFFDECHSMFDYLPENTPVVMVGNNFSSASRFWGEVNRRFEEYGVDPRRPLVEPRRGFIPVEELYAAIGKHCVLEFMLKDTEVNCFELSPVELS